MVYDLVIIGGGPAGYVAAERAAQGGMKTLLLEKRRLGGVCLNEGCIPTKSLLYSAKLLDSARDSKAYGVTVEGASIDHAKVIARKNKVVRTLVGGVSAMLKGLGVEVVSGEARIAGRTDDGYKVECAGETYVGRRLLIAAGSHSARPPITGLKAGLESGFVLTNREILELDTLPKRLAVIGGGVIGLEMASYFLSCGGVVTVVEALDHIAGQMDAEIGKLLQKNYEKKGMTFHLSAKVSEIAPDGVVFEKDGASHTLSTDKVLLSIGRRPSAEGLGLETIGVALENSAIITDERMRTNVPDVFAAGDINGKSMLAHTAYREAEVAVNQMLGVKDKMRYNAVPSVIYTNPELGSVGETLASAVGMGLRASEVKASMRYSGRYVAENEGGDGIAKLVFDDDTRTVIGAHVLSNYASEFIVAAGIMIERQIPLNQLKEIIFPHPTVGEIIRDVIFQYHPKEQKS